MEDAQMSIVSPKMRLLLISIAIALVRSDTSSTYYNIKSTANTLVESSSVAIPDKLLRVTQLYFIIIGDIMVPGTGLPGRAPRHSTPQRLVQEFSLNLQDSSGTRNCSLRGHSRC